MRGELFINGKDAFDTWGISLTDGSISSLMTPAPQKPLIENKSRNEHGKRVINTNPKVDERDLSIQIHLTAKDKEDFFAKYESFCEELAKGVLEIRTKYQPTVLYRTNYLNCSQYGEFMFGIGKYTLKLNEPNPMNRSLE